MTRSRDIFRVLPQYQPLMRVLGIDAAEVFRHPQIVVWRKLKDRENCTLDAEFKDKAIRLHIKRYRRPRWFAKPADEEVAGIIALQKAAIPTVPLVGWGRLSNGRSFVITEDLAGYADAEKLVQSGLPFESLLNSTADLAGMLHNANLHHRDLYLCHFFARRDDPNDLRLIDVARVRPMGMMRNRWIVKDLAQFWYSTRSLATDEQRDRWLTRYAQRRNLQETHALKDAIVRKANWIARHDAKLKRKQPRRNVSIPSAQVK